MIDDDFQYIDPDSNNRTPAAKKKERDQIAADVAKFLSGGGEINVIPGGVVTAPDERTEAHRVSAKRGAAAGAVNTARFKKTLKGLLDD